MTLVNDTLIKLNIILLHVEPAPPLASPLPAPALPRICRHPRSSETIKTNFTAALKLAFLADNGNPGLAMHSSNKATKLATFEQRMKRILKCAAAGGVGGEGTCVSIMRGCRTVQHSSVVLPRLAAVCCCRCCCCKLRAGDLPSAPLKAACN